MFYKLHLLHYTLSHTRTQTYNQVWSNGGDIYIPQVKRYSPEVQIQIKLSRKTLLSRVV